MTSLHIRKENKARSAANRATHEEKRQHREVIDLPVTKANVKFAANKLIMVLT